MPQFFLRALSCPSIPCPVGRGGAVHAVLLGISLMSRCLGQTAFQDFNVPGQYNNSFNPFENAGTGTNGGSYSFQEGATVGVGGSGGVSVFQNNDTTAT